MGFNILLPIIVIVNSEFIIAEYEAVDYYYNNLFQWLGLPLESTPEVEGGGCTVFVFTSINE